MGPGPEAHEIKFVELPQTLTLFYVVAKSFGLFLKAYNLLSSRSDKFAVYFIIE